MARRNLLLLTLALACGACAPTTASTPATDVSTPSAMPDTPGPAIPAPQGWAVYLSDEVGFAFAYPDSGTLSYGTGMPLATITFAVDPATNVVEERVLVSGVQGEAECASPLGEGWAPGDLSPETVEINGVSFLRQTHSGVAAGTSSVWVAYSTWRDQRCVSLGYELRTFDPANLDPTRFPSPPAMVDVGERIRGFEAMIATFAWLR